MIKGETVEAVAQRAKEVHQLDSVQLRLTLPAVELDPINPDPDACARVRDAFTARGVEIAAVACYTNLVSPDPEERRRNLDRIKGALRFCAQLGSTMVTTESGSFNPHDEWEADPFNYSPEAWRELTGSVAELLQVAEESGSILVLEPYVLNVLNTPEAARRLVKEMGSDNLRLLLDPAGLLYPQTADSKEKVRDVMRRAIENEGEYLGLVHAEDAYFDAAGPHFLGAGKGVLDYHFFMQALHDSGYTGSLILEHLADAEISQCGDHVRTAWASAAGASPN